MASTDRELGIAGDVALTVDSSQGGIAGDVQIWDVQKFSERVDIGETAFFGVTSGLGGGVFLRVRLNNSKGAYVGGQGELGVGWGGLALPVSGKVGDKLWLYTNPAVRLVVGDITGDVPNISLAPQIFLPAGASLGLGKGFRLHSEVNLTLGGTMEYYDTPGYGRFALGGGYRW